MALHGFLADEVPHYDLAAMQDIVTAPIQAKGLALEYIGASKLGAPIEAGISLRRSTRSMLSARATKG